MKHALLGTLLLCGVARIALSQSPDAAPKFEIADVHTSPKSSNMYFRTPVAKGGRYEIKMATMVDLIRTAYGYEADKILGGPNWLEMDRFDITAKLPPDSTPETLKLMLQSLLADRVQLKIHAESKPLSSYFLIAGKKLQLKEADGTGETGCKPSSTSDDPTPGPRLVTMGQDGKTTTIAFGADGTIHYLCRNMTMESFADGLKSLMGASLGSAPVKDETGLKGAWNFDFRFSTNLTLMNSTPGAQISLFDALEKQAGLKLEERKVPLPVMVVESVNQTPSPNPANLEEVMPSYPMPTEFEVASLKPADPAGRATLGVQAGGRFNAIGASLQTLFILAFNYGGREQVVGIPGWAISDRYDVIAKVPSRGPMGPPSDLESMAPLVRALLVERFKMKYHTEDRPTNAYSLVAVKPKLKKADPANRSSCKSAAAPAGSPPGSRQIVCLNVTLARFAEQLRGAGPDSNLPVLDATGIEGNYDIAVTYSQNAMRAAVASVGAAGAPEASEPSGGYTVLEALEKQLGLKLELQKRNAPVLVIDHIEQKPTEN